MHYHTRYKACEPERTINNIRNILHEIGINVRELHFEKDNIHSCSICMSHRHFDDLSIRSFGKGSTYEYSMASGYAEFMERLQNRILFSRNKMYYATKSHIDGLSANSEMVQRLRSVNAILDFVYDEREEYWNLEEVLKIFGSQLSLIFNVENTEEVNNLIKSTLNFKDKILMIPGYLVNEAKEIFFPIDLMSFATGSNGMCAGNTQNEALLQGVCEIMERYAASEIFYREMTPPTVPLEQFEKTPIYNKVKHLTEKRGYEIVIKDCSLGKGLPVMGVLIIDRKNLTYNFKLGSDFIPYVAVDRCLNEVYQSSNGFKGLPLNLNWKEKYSGKKLEERIDYQWYKITTTGEGLWPMSLFFSEPSYNYIPPVLDWDTLDKDKVQYCFDLIRSLGYDIYIRNNSSLGFPTYHIFVPGMSQLIFKKREYERLPTSSGGNISTGDIRRISQLKREKAAQLADMIKWYLDYNDPSKFIGNNLLYNTDKDLLDLDARVFLCMLYYYSGKYSEAKESLGSFLRFKKPCQHLYHHAVLMYIDLRFCKKYSLKELTGMMIKIYGKQITSEVFSDMNDPDKVFQYYDLPNCFECETCGVKTTCRLFDLAKIENRINTQAKENRISYKQKITL